MSLRTFVNEVNRIHGNTLNKVCQRSLRSLQMDSEKPQSEDYLPTCCLNPYRDGGKKHRESMREREFLRSQE